MKYLFMLITILSLPLKAADLTSVDNDELAYVLGTANLLYEGKPSTQLPYFIRIFTSSTHIGECWGGIETCPDKRLFITVSLGDLYEVPRLLELPPEKGWKYVSHKALGEQGVEIVLITTLPEANINLEERGLWIPKEYRITVGSQNSFTVLPLTSK